jgi:hypothetical protein
MTMQLREGHGATKTTVNSRRKRMRKNPYENPYNPATRSKLMHALLDLSLSLPTVCDCPRDWWKTPDVLDWLASDLFEADLKTLQHMRDEAIRELESEDERAEMDAY